MFSSENQVVPRLSTILLSQRVVNDGVLDDALVSTVLCLKSFSFPAILIQIIEQMWTIRMALKN